MGHFNKESWDKTMSQANKITRAVIRLLLPVGLLMAAVSARAVTVDNIEYTMLSARSAQILLTLSEPVKEPSSFTIDNPARLAVDLPGVGLNVEERSIDVESGVVRSIRAVEAGGRTRLVVKLLKLVPYDIRTEANQVFIRLTESDAETAGPREAVGMSRARINDIDFKRGIDGSAVVTVKLSDENASISVNQKGSKVVADFYNFELPDELTRRLDVADFATPAQFLDFYSTSTGARLSVTANGNFEHLAYQAGDMYTIELKPLTEAEAEEARRDEFGYYGEKLSLNFQNIEVRAVLQLIADFTGLNIVASDSVKGSITLRLKNVPWDQALDIILKTRGLGMRKSGNVVLVAPNDELAAREKQELEAQKQMVELAPLHTEFYTINYAKASDIAKLLKADNNSILSPRGNVSLDERTNTLMVLETAEKHEEVARLIDKLDVPVRQVLIESRIVIANDDFSKDLGVRVGYTGVRALDEHNLTATSGTSAGTDVMVDADGDNARGLDALNTGPDVEGRYNVNFPASASNAASIAWAILGKNYLVDLELSALQTEGRGEVVSNPRVVTSNQTEAVIEQGVEIPYQEASSSGATSVSFKKAVLSLSVTPQITPDDRVVMDLEVSKDSVGGIYSGIPSINTRSVTTQVLVDNGDTVVLGGIYETSTAVGENKVPLLGDIPLLGYLFRSKSNTESKAELLVFVTPKILNEGLTAAVE